MGHYERLILLSSLLVALGVRLTVLLYSFDIPGDGPTRAILAYQWARAPHLMTHGVLWLPGFTYFGGLFHWLVDGPPGSVRLLNVLIGSATVPLLYTLVKRLYGFSVALFTAVVMLFLPLHVGLSASSLSEASFVAEIVAGTLLLQVAAEKIRGGGLYLSSSLLCLSAAVMTRYEAWLLIPLFPLYYWWKTGRGPGTGLIMAVLLIFPVAWLTGNYLHGGEVFPAFRAHTKTVLTAMDAQSVGLHGALDRLARMSVAQLGWLVFAGIIVGTGVQVGRILMRKANVDQALHVSMTSLFWAFIAGFAMVRGRSLVERFLLFGLVSALPLAVAPFERHIGKCPKRLNLVIALALVSMLGSYWAKRPVTYVTRRQPVEIQELAAWLQGSRYRDDPILLTKMGWQSSYFALYSPEHETLIVSPWTADATLEEFFRRRRPSLLVTRDGDGEQQARIERILGLAVHRLRMVHSKGRLQVYAINDPV